MKYARLILEKKEYVYLKRALSISGYLIDHTSQKYLMNLLEDLKTAHILDHQEMPQDIIRFNSVVTLVLENSLEKQLQVVMPTESDIKKNKISVLTAVGAALIGHSKYDAVICDVPVGKQLLKIIDVAQKDSFNGLDIII